MFMMITKGNILHPEMKEKKMRKKGLKESIVLSIGKKSLFRRLLFRNDYLGAKTSSILLS